jgi:hypothetical protein
MNFAFQEKRVADARSRRVVREVETPSARFMGDLRP